MRKLTREDVPVILEMMRTQTQVEIARHYGVTKQAVNYIIGKVWKPRLFVDNPENCATLGIGE